MKKVHLLKSMLLLCALIVGVGSTWGQTYQQLTSIANIDESADYVLGIDGTGFHYDGTSSWGKIALPSDQTPIYYKLKKASDGNSFTAEATISNTKYYLQIPTSNTFSMATSTGTNTDIIIGTTQVSGTNYAVANKTTKTRHLRIGISGLRSYAGTTGSMAFFYKVIPAFTLTAVSNNTSWGTVSVSGNKITANPATGYRISTTTPYTVTSGSATVTQNENVFTVTASAACTVRINFEEGPKYQVSFNAQAGTCTTSSHTESVYQGGVTLPEASITMNGWTFAGWATAAVANTNTIATTLYKAGTTFYPSANITLYAVYTLTNISDKFVRASSVNQVIAANSIVIVNNKDSYILDHSATKKLSAPTETSGEITTAANTVFAFAGNNEQGFTITGAEGTLGATTLATSSANDKAIDWSENNNKWIIEANSYNSLPNLFVLRNAASNSVALEYDGGWKTYYVQSYTSNQYTAMKLYVAKTIYDSNPTSAIITPTVAFTSSDDKTLYLDGTTTYTNAATVTGVSKTITYTSSDTNVATVDDGGKVTAVGIGEATITASVEAELGVSSAASDTYNVVVKTSTIAGTKTLATSSAQVSFSADFTDAVITYVSGTHAYIQDGTAAIYASCATNDWTAGKKFSGPVTGKIKKSYGVYEITELTATPVSGGVIPEAIEIAITDITSDTYLTYEGKKVVLNNITVSTAMASTATSGGEVSDGTNTIKIGAPATGITLTKDERGNITGFVAQYNGTFRLNLYEQTQFAKTHNAPTDQDLEFASYAFSLDEDTDDYDNFTGQQVSGAQGTVSYAKTSDTDNIITSLNTETGEVALSGAYGTATITATAAATEVTESGVTTPYNETTKSYTITVYPRYSVVFSINGVETTVRQATHGESIDVAADPEDIGAYKFQGWVENEVAAGSSEPDNYVNLSSTYTPTANKTFYAVFALESVLPDVEQTSTFTFNGSSVTSPYTNGEITWTFSSVSFGSSNCGLKSQSLSFAPSKNVTSIEAIEIIKPSNLWAQAVYLTLKDANDTEIFKIYGGNNNSSFTNDKYSKDLTNNQSSSYTLASSGNAWLSSIKITYLAPGLNYSDYRTSITIPESVTATIASSGFTTYCSPYDLSFENVTGLTAAYVVSESTNAVATLKKVTAVPGGTGVVLKGNPGAVTIPVAEYAGEDVSNILIGTLVETTVTAETVYVVSGGKFMLFAGTTIPAGKAYLPVSAISSDGNAPSLSFEFDDNTTAIQSVERTINDNQYYTLDGRRVAQPTKGLYILNGRKVIVK